MIQRVSSDITAAMRARDQETLDTLRLLKTALTNKRVELARDLQPGEALQVVTTLVKQRRDSSAQFAAAGRQDMADKEQREAGILEQYLPAALGDDALTAVIDIVIAETGAREPRDMGKVMKALMSRLAGQVVDGKLVNERVKARLGSSG